jgi:outer membrane protein assembly factor BamB
MLRRKATRPRDDRPGRRRHSVLVVLFAASLTAIVSPRGAAAATVWRQPGFSATHGGYNPRETAIDPSTVAALVERWRVTGILAPGSPVVADGRIFVSNGSELIALSTDDGSELWRKSIMDTNECCSIGDPLLTPDGKITTRVGWIGGGGSAKFDPATGAFTYDLELHGGQFNQAIRGDDVFAVNYGYGSGGPLLYSLGGPTPYQGLIYFGGLQTTIVKGPSLRDHFAFVTMNSTLQAFDLSSCTDPIGDPSLMFCGPAWTEALPAKPYAPIAFRDGVAVAAADDTLRIFAAATGDLEWSASIAAGIGQDPAISRRRIFVASKRGLMLAFDARGCGAATCAPVARFQLGGRASGQPVVAGNVVYAGTKRGHVVAFAERGCERRACVPLWNEDVGGGAIVAGPIVIDGLVIVGTADGQIVAYGAPPPM